MMRIALFLLTAAGAALCQPAASLKFDVAAIKLSAPGRFGGNPMLGDNIHFTPDSLTMRRVTLKDCVAWAYHVFSYQVSGPNGIEGDHFDIAAKSAGPASEQDLRAMLQSLLADRFQLELHRQVKEVQAFVLTVGKNGPKFHESKTQGDADIEPDQKTMSVQVHRVPISQLIDPLAHIFQMPVVDRTGLKGRYDVEISVAKYIPQAGDRPDPLSIIQTALEEELGLKLEAKKMPVDFLIVDHAAKTPTEN